MDIQKLLAGIDHTLSTKNLYPEDQDRLYVLRGRLELELERRQGALEGLDLGLDDHDRKGGGKHA